MIEELTENFLIEIKQKFENSLIEACAAKGFTLNLATAADFYAIGLIGGKTKLVHIPTKTAICIYSLDPEILHCDGRITATYTLRLL